MNTQIQAIHFKADQKLKDYIEKNNEARNLYTWNNRCSSFLKSGEYASEKKTKLLK